MKFTLKQFFFPLISSLLVVGGVILAGSLTPTSGTPEATYVSLNDIYDQLTTGATSTEKTFTPTVGTDTATMHTLSDIFTALPAWQTLSDSTTTVSAGYYEVTDLATVDPDLNSDNIVSGATIFGVEGSYTTPEGDSIVWSDSDDYEGYIDWYTAGSTCSDKTTGGYAWRLPTAIELLQKYIESSGNPGFNLDSYWSGVTHPLETVDAYVADMSYGFIAHSTKEYPTSLVRCVHD